MTIKSTAKAESVARELKDKLSLRGFVVEESKTASGWPKLSMSSIVSVKIEAIDAVSKDIFGNDLKAFAPHTVEIAMVEGSLTSLSLVKIMQEVGKLGMKVILKSSSVDLATAEAAAGDEVVSDVLFPSFGA